MIASHWDTFRAYLWSNFITRFILLVIVLRTNEMHNSYDQFFIPQFFLSALHVSGDRGGAVG